VLSGSPFAVCGTLHDPRGFFALLDRWRDVDLSQSAARGRGRQSMRINAFRVLVVPGEP
jgi:hypothetical protein